MADVSHELGSLRFVVESPLSSKVAMFNNQVQQHKHNQLLNPFSGGSGRASPKPTFSKDEYGKPLAGSLTEMRGQKANMHVLKEMLELCQIIDSEGYKVNDEPNMRVIPFGELFNIYNYISDKVVGILLRARKHKLVDFEGEMLFQRRDDDVPIFLLRPIVDIRHELESKVEDIKRASSPAPQATTLMLDKGAHQQKLQESALGTPKKTLSRTPSPASKKASRPPTPAVASAAIATPTTPSIANGNNTNPVEAPVIANVLVEVAQKLEAAAATESSTAAQESNALAAPADSVQQTRAEAGEEPQPVTRAAAADAAAPVPVESDKIDINNNDNNSTASDLPTTVIEATAVHMRTIMVVPQITETPPPEVPEGESSSAATEPNNIV